MADQDLTNPIRTIFLHQRPHVTIAEATVLLGWTREEMARAIAAGEVEVNSTAIGKWIWREELMAKALEIWPMEIVEEALGADAERVLPAGVRLTELRVRLPRHQVAMLEHFAERDRTTVSAALAKELDGVASAHADELAWAVGGFAEALAWPDAEAAAGVLRGVACCQREPPERGTPERRRLRRLARRRPACGPQQTAARRRRASRRGRQRSVEREAASAERNAIIAFGRSVA